MIERLDDVHVPSDLAGFYDGVASQSPNVQAMMYRNWNAKRRFDRVVEIAKLMPQHGTCLELGCAEGLMTVKLADVFKTVDAVEISRIMLDRCPPLPGVRYHCADAVDFEPPMDRYDVVIMSEVLEHVHDPVAMLHKYARIGRRLIASCPVTEYPNTHGAFDADLFGHEERQADATGHIWYMDWQGFMSLFKGLKVIVAERIGHSGIVVCASDI